MFDKEILTTIKIIEHFVYFLFNIAKSFIIITDNNASKEIINGTSEKVIDNRRKKDISKDYSDRMSKIFI